VNAAHDIPLETRTGLGPEAVRSIAEGLNTLLADMFALYLKAKNFHWHMSGSHFRDDHLLLEEQADTIFAATDPIAERVRKLGASTRRSIGDISRRQRLFDNNADYVTRLQMLKELREDNLQLMASLREAHGVCEEHDDVASTSLLEGLIDEAERRSWFLFEAGQGLEEQSHDESYCGTAEAMPPTRAEPLAGAE